MMKNNLIVLLGPTASGKTALAARLAVDFHGEIISADSRQVYRGMDIGTGKDLTEFCRDGKSIPYHMIDILDPQEEFSVFDFQKRFYRIFEDIVNRRVMPVLVGGTGLYLESVLLDYMMPPTLSDETIRSELAGKSQTQLREMLLAMKPDLHNRTDLDDRDRILKKIEIEKARQYQAKNRKPAPLIQACVFGVHWERSELRRRIAVRLKQRIDEGMVEEVKGLHAQGITWQRLDSFGLEYRYIARYLQKEISFDDMILKLQIAIGQFAKRQMTWFRRMEKKGIRIEWVPGGDYGVLHRRVLDILS